MFRLTVAFGVVTRSEMEVHIESLPYTPKEVQDELWPSVRGSIGRNIVFGENMDNKQLGELRGGNHIKSGNKDALFGHPINDD